MAGAKAGVMTTAFSVCAPASVGEHTGGRGNLRALSRRCVLLHRSVSTVGLFLISLEYQE